MPSHRRASIGFVSSLLPCLLAGSCSYDFDGAFAQPPLYAPGPDSGDGSTLEGGSDGADAPDGSTPDGCWPSCTGKCPGADNGCGEPCTGNDCDGTCCDTACCDPGEVCDDEDQCCAPRLCNVGGLECGTHDDGCGGTISCGACSEGPCSADGQCTGCPYGACNGACCDAGQVCAPTGTCCTPWTCSDLGVACGIHDDGCGNSMSCGTCAPDSYCLTGQSCSPLALRFVAISAGTFTMGSPSSEAGRDTYNADGLLDETEHEVALTRAFEMAETEVTQGDFETVMGYNPSYFDQCGHGCPVESLTWNEAARFCNALSELKQLAPCFDCTGSGGSVSCELASVYASPYECAGYRLPTEAEWEYAARGGTQTAFSSGGLLKHLCNELDSNLSQIAWYVANSAVSYAGSLGVTCDGTGISIGTHPVGQRSANDYGLHDMAGNVWEWVFECGAGYPTTPQINPVGPLGCANNRKLFRGGGMGNVAALCRHAERANEMPSDGKNIDIGFRPVRTLP